MYISTIIFKNQKNSYLFSNFNKFQLKRTWYRCLPHKLCTINVTSDIISISELKGMLNLPEVVFGDKGIIKMYDIYPIQLFYFESFIKFYEFGLSQKNCKKVNFKIESASVYIFIFIFIYVGRSLR